MPYTAYFQPRSLLATACVAAVALAGCASRPEAPATPAVTTAPAPAVPAAASVAEPAAPPAAEDSRSRLNAQEFERWKQAFTAKAADAGISAATLRNIANARLRPNIVNFDRAQPEFTRTPWQYLDSAVSPLRIKNGKAKMQEAAPALQAAAKRYGVPASVIAAIWGMESNYGSNFGNFSTIDAFATLAFEGRRAAWAEKELIAALRIIDNGDIDAAHMVGSWAGAMGHTQFLPSVYLAHAVDADGDGRRDIWGSVPDVLASTANFLAHSGWQAGQPWGVEVRLPPGFDYARTELNVRQDSQAWALDGVRAVDGQPLPALPNAAIVTPAGASGPAILVGPNFGALLRYNNSVNYALAVGLLARQIDGGDGLLTPWPRDLPALSRGEIKVLQQALNDRGFGAGAVDGVLGPATRAGVRRLQQSLGLPADGFATPQLLERLQAP